MTVKTTTFITATGSSDPTATRRLTRSLYVRLFWTRVLPDDCQAVMPPSRFQTFV